MKIGLSVFAGIALSATFAPLGAHAVRVDDCSPSHVRISLSMAGSPPPSRGAIAVAVNLRNVGKAECSIEGHPLVVVSPHPYPIIVGDLAHFDRNDPSLGPERVLYLRPGGAASAQVVIARRCGGAKKEMTSTIIRLSASGKSAALGIPACRRQGVEIDTGPFLPKP